MTYIDISIERLNKLKAQEPLFETVSNIMVDTILNNKTLYFFGTGHSHMIAEEVYVRAGAFAPFQAILIPELMLHESANKSTDIERLSGYAQIVFDQVGFKKGDMLFIISNSGRNAVPLELATLAKKAGVTTVAITSFTHSKSVTPRFGDKRLMDLTDYAIDNLTDLGDASIEIKENLKIGPISTITGSAIVNTLQIKMVEKLMAQGKDPEVFLSSNVEDTAINDTYFRNYHGVKK